MVANNIEFGAVLKRIKQLDNQIKEYDAVTKPLKEELAIQKLQVLEYMQSIRSKRTDNIDGLTATRAERKGFEIKDERAVIQWLRTNGFNPDDYAHLDKNMVRTTAEAALEMNGELIPGVAETTTEYITIKEVA